MTHRTRRREHREAGFTLVEVLVTMALMGLVMAFAVTGWNAWAASRQHSGTAQEITSHLRQAQQRAVTEGRATCVLFDVGRSEWSVFLGACDSTEKVRVQGPVKTASPKVVIASAAFTGTASIGQPGVTFSARGTAWPGQVSVTRPGTSKTYVVKVEGLTGRVSLN